MLYETSRELAEQSYQNWVSNELFTFGWFFILATLAIVYFVWIKLVDKNRLNDLLLLGSLSSVGFFIADQVLIGDFGVIDNKIRIFPIVFPVFIVSITICPILFMLVQQYTSSWKSFSIWAGIGSAFLAFGLFPVHTLLGIIQLHRWNYFYEFLLMFIGGMLSRAAYLWIIRIKQRHLLQNEL